MNLGVNALDAMPDGGTLTFAAEARESRLRVSVRDTGHGIPDEATGRIFQPFFTTKPPGRGTGLGLFVTRRIVEDLGGTLEVAETGPGGTTFVVNLPANPGGES